MTPELTYLFGSVMILFVLVGFQGALGASTSGLSWGLGNRDDQPTDTTFAARVQRTLNNHVEGLLIFGGAVLIADAAGISNSLTVTGSMLYFWARLAYAPLYIIGIPYVRTAIWTVGLIGTIMVLWAIGSTLI